MIIKNKALNKGTTKIGSKKNSFGQKRVKVFRIIPTNNENTVSTNIDPTTQK